MSENMNGPREPPVRVSIFTSKGNLSGRIENNQVIITIVDSRVQKLFAKIPIGRYSMGRTAGLWTFPPDQIELTREWAKKTI